MAKTPRVKNANPSKNSRAARRAAEPPSRTLSNLANEAAEIKPAKQKSHYGGVSKKTKHVRLSRAQRLRREKGIERAEAVVDQMEIKKIQSSGRTKRVKDRSGDWRDVNGKIVKSKSKGAFAALDDRDEAGNTDDDEWEEDDEADDAVQEQEAIQAVTALNVSDPIHGSDVRVDGGDNEDEVL